MQITHMPPELINEGKMSKAVDVYGFGVLLWEVRPRMIHGRLAMDGLRINGSAARNVSGCTSFIVLPHVHGHLNYSTRLGVALLHQSRGLSTWRPRGLFFRFPAPSLTAVCCASAAVRR